MFRRILIASFLLGGCQSSRRTEWLSVTKSRPIASESHLPVLLSDSELKSFLPSRLGDRVGQSPRGEMTRIGDRALSEASRSYLEQDGAGTPEVHLKLADARLEPAAAQAVRSLAGGCGAGGEGCAAEALLSERLELPGAIGYARYDEGDRVAQAQVLIGDRFIASATVEQAEDAQEAAQALRALDTLAIARRAQVTQ